MTTGPAMLDNFSLEMGSFFIEPENTSSRSYLISTCVFSVAELMNHLESFAHIDVPKTELVSHLIC